MDIFRKKCWNCKSTNYKETISLKFCSECGIKCDYWSGEVNEQYKKSLETKHYIDKLEREEFQREWEIENGYE